MNLSTKVSARNRSLDCSSSSSTPLNSARWSLLISYIHTNTLTTYWHTAGDHRQKQTLNGTSCRAAFNISTCGCEVIDCRLQLNTSKTKFIWYCPLRRRQHIPESDFRVDTYLIKQVSAACNLVFVDSEMSMPYISCCFVMFYCDAPDSLNTNITTTCCVIRRLQLVLNLSVRLVNGSLKYDHVMSLRNHHWLPFEKRIEYTS